MDNQNPYSPPMTDLTKPVQNAEMELAGRGSRLGAALIDGVISMIYAIPLFMVFGGMESMRRGENLPFMSLAIFSVLSIAAYTLVHGYFLKANGQTVGKKIVGIRIANLEGNNPGLPHILLKRLVPVALLSVIPGIGPFIALIDALFIFRSDKRCLHDLIAGTQVVVAK
ncbi:MAG: RDD family protein [Pseudomonadota bacterium]